MERELRIYEMNEAANLVSLARSWLVHDRFPLEYAATRARRAISLKAVRHGNDDLWSFFMLPDSPPVSRLPPFFYSPAMHRCNSDIHSSWQRVVVNAARSNPPTPEPAHARGTAAGARAGDTQEGAKDSAAGASGTAG
jgi:hypothetical protein